jgi:hypothetical protein
MESNDARKRQTVLLDYPLDYLTQISPEEPCGMPQLSQYQRDTNALKMVGI